MIKLSTIQGVGADGRPITPNGQRRVEMLYHPDQLHHSYLDKVAAAFLPEIREYLERLRPHPRYIYSLVNAIGAYEYWSSNTNGDAVEEEYLVHDGPLWGYKTFEHFARVFAHHANKGPNARCFGDVELSCYNPNMHRVELIVKLDREKARRVNAQSTIDKIDRDLLPDVSMGLRVLFDLCSITTDWDTFHRVAADRYDPKRHPHPGYAVLEYHKRVKPIRGLSLTKDDYSDYAKHRMNEILPDGRKVCVFNPWPRFFDLSFVFIGAEKTAKMMAKLAASTSYHFMPSSYVAEICGYQETGRDFLLEQPALEKAASARKTAAQKMAEMDKRYVPTQFAAKAAPLLEDSEAPIDSHTLDDLGQFPLEEALSSLSTLGITLKPREFQRMVLIRLGKKDTADELDRDGCVFRPVDGVDSSISLSGEHVLPELLNALRPFIEGRSAYGPPLRRRMIRITICKRNPEDDDETIEGPLMDKISAAYNGYRDQHITKLAELSRFLDRSPLARMDVLGVNADDVMMNKCAALSTSKALLGAIPAAYLLSSYARYKNRRGMYSGEDPGILSQLVGDHPHLFAAAAALGAAKATGSKVPDKLLGALVKAGKHIISG